ncbi:MAG: hypothetical protein RR147_02950 [Oscillospiraceae bacterium]
MKKTIAVILASMMLVVALAGCAKKDEPKESASPAPTESVEPATTDDAAATDAPAAATDDAAATDAPAAATDAPAADATTSPAA